MKTFLRTGTAALILVLAACAGTSSLDMGVLNGAEINNFRAPEAEVLSTGQPTADQLRVMASAGVKHIINLRGLGEDCLLYTSPSPRDATLSRMPSSA